MADPQRILLLGATGRIGRLVLYHWRVTPPAGVEVIEHHRDPDREDGLYWPLQDPPGDLLDSERVDVIISLAGVTPGPGANLSQNSLLAQAVLGAAHQAGIRRVLIASSSAVYGAGDGTPFLETDPTAPVNAYGEAKLAMEQACAPWRECGLEICCLRIGNVAGADALLSNVSRASPEQALSIDQFSDGSGPVRSYIGAATLGEVLCDLAQCADPLPPILNIAAPRFVSMEDLACAAGYSYVFKPAPAGAYQRITLDCRRLKAWHTFDALASDPARMVTQWKETLHR